MHVERFRATLNGLGGFHLGNPGSINDRPEVRTLSKNFRIEDVATRCSANAKAAKRMGELLIYG